MSKLLCLKCRGQPGEQTADDAKELANDYKAEKGMLVYLCTKCTGKETLYYFAGHGRKDIMAELASDAEFEKIKQSFYGRIKKQGNEHCALKHIAGIVNKAE